MARNENRGPRLDQPLERGRSLRPTFDAETAGRVSARVARFLGSWRFLGYMTFVVFSWLLWNIFAPEKFRVDAFPFLFLTLALSLQASYAAPLILLAQNRQADRDRVTSQEDRARDERNLAVTEFMVREIAGMRKDLIKEFKEILDERLGTDSKPDTK